jgi:glycine betaine/choline ABC-type transport system substrate-binding protein
VGGGLIVLLSTYAAYGLADRAFISRRADIVVGAKDFTEGQILAEILKQTLEAHTEPSVEIKHQLGTSVILKALQNGEIDLYPEYTGNLLTSKEGLDMAVPADKSTITDLVRKEMQRKHGLVLLEPFGLVARFKLLLSPASLGQHGRRVVQNQHPIAPLCAANGGPP